VFRVIHTPFFFGSEGREFLCWSPVDDLDVVPDLLPFLGELIIINSSMKSIPLKIMQYLYFNSLSVTIPVWHLANL
jgi:hypothetical protein